MASGYTPMSPEPSPKKNDPAEKCQLPDESDDEELLITVSPEGYSDETMKTFIIKNQTHTLGAVLRDQLLRYPQVQFAGYSIPHPSEKVLHLRVQTVPKSGIPASKMFKKALQDIIAQCEHVEDVFLNDLERWPDSMRRIKP